MGIYTEVSLITKCWICISEKLTLCSQQTYLCWRWDWRQGCRVSPFVHFHSSHIPAPWVVGVSRAYTQYLMMTFYKLDPINGRHTCLLGRWEQISSGIWAYLGCIWRHFHWWSGQWKHDRKADNCTMLDRETGLLFSIGLRVLTNWGNWLRTQYSMMKFH